MSTGGPSKGLPAATVVSAAGLIAYQDGAVVSRELMRTPGGTVSVFAFDAGEGLSEHTAPFDAMVHVVDGEAEVTIAGKAHRLRSGEMILMPAGAPHALSAVTRFKMVLTMIRTPEGRGG